MAKKFDLDDEVVVIIGSGAGGGTLGNELAKKVLTLLFSKQVSVMKSMISKMMNGQCLAKYLG